MLDVFSCKNEKFEIQTASYEFLDNIGNIESSGTRSIYEHQIDTVIEPKRKYDYTLKIAYKILDEILIEMIGITAM